MSVGYSKLNIFSVNITPNGIKQLDKFLQQPVFDNAKISIMPDYENYSDGIVGLSAVVQKDNINKISPEILGNDIGCGVLVVKTDKKTSDIDLMKIDKYIKFSFPNKDNVNLISKNLKNKLNYLKPLFGEKKFDEIINSFSTIGNGNHFIELDSDEEDNLYLIIHSGSRKLGAALCELYSEVQKINRKNMLNAMPIPYIDAVALGNQFAKENRMAIAEILLKKFNIKIQDILDCPHNYISDDNVIHKGSIDAQKGKKVVILLNSKDGAILGTGKGNSDWNFSAPHGAGRKLTRSEARKQLKFEDYKYDMAKVYSSSVSFKTIDDAPRAYNDSDKIISSIEPTVETDKILRPVYNYRKK